MTGREWKPGDVALVEGQTALRHEDGGWVNASGAHVLNEASAHLLVVIDPEDRETLEKFAAWTADGDYAEWRIQWVQNFLRSLIAPPKPEEPTNRFAVVADVDGCEWIRDREGRWFRSFNHACYETRPYADIDVVKVLSEGVTTDG